MNIDTANNGMGEIRAVLFPAIGIQVITGFNLYNRSSSGEISQESNERNIKISYLHEDLLEDRLHYIQIKGMLERYCDQIRTQRIQHEVVTRFSSYRLEGGWRAEQYFLVDQTVVEKEEVDDLVRRDITVIGCGLQNELVIICEEDAMQYIIEQFRLYANKYEIDPETGEFVLIPSTNKKRPNPNQTWDEAWEIPTVTVHAYGVDRIKTYERVRKISFDIHDGTVSLIIGDKWDTSYETNKPRTLLIPSFEQYLALRDFRPVDVRDNYFANRIFFNWINEINWRRVAKTLELYGNLFKGLL